VFSAALRGIVTSSVTLDSPSMTFSETRLTNFASRTGPHLRLQTARRRPQLPFWERSPLPFLRQPSLHFSMPWEHVVQGRFVLRRPSPGCGSGLGAGHRNRPSPRPLNPSVFAAICNRALLPGEERVDCFLRLCEIWREAGHALRDRRSLVQSSLLPQSLRQQQIPHIGGLHRHGTRVLANGLR
jgi:hypothetical protein